MTKWMELRLGDIAEINPETLSKDYPFDAIDYIDISSVGTGILRETTTYFLKEAPSRAKRLVKANDIILSTVRPNRRSILYLKNPKPNQVVSTGFAVLRPKESIEPRFLYYVISNQRFTDYLVSNEQGAAYPAVNMETIANAKIIVPEKCIQEQISSILGAIDDKIEINLQINETLEKMAITLYNELLLEATHSKNTLQLRDLITLNPRISVKKGTVLKYVDMKALPTKQMSVSNEDIIEKEYKSGTKFMQDDVLLARITPCLENGKSAFVDFLSEGEIAFGSTEFLVFRSNERSCPQFLYCLIKDPNFHEFAKQSMVGTSGRQRIQNEILLDYTLPSIDTEQMERFNKNTKKLFNKVRLNSIENTRLRQIRDYLLPRLLTGEIDIRKAKKHAEEVL